MLFFKYAPLRVPTPRDEDTIKVRNVVGAFIQVRECSKNVDKEIRKISETILYSAARNEKER